MKPKPDYGIDSPAIVTGLFVLGLGGLSLSVLLRRTSPHLHWVGLIAGAYFLLGAVGMLYYSKAGKFAIRDRLLDSITWRGDETVLDVGCGRGLLVVAAARRLRTGKATGVDIWLRSAITGNTAAAVLENARLEGVADRVETKEGDIRNLPFADASFDVVISNYVLHELQQAPDREKMIREMVRVLKPGGQLALADFIFTRDCVELLRKYGIEDAARTRDGSAVAFWISAILNFGSVQTYRVTGRKATIMAAAS